MCAILNVFPHSHSTGTVYHIPAWKINEISVKIIMECMAWVEKGKGKRVVHQFGVVEKPQDWLYGGWSSRIPQTWSSDLVSVAQTKPTILYFSSKETLSNKIFSVRKTQMKRPIPVFSRTKLFASSRHSIMRHSGKSSVTWPFSYGRGECIYDSQLTYFSDF